MRKRDMIFFRSKKGVAPDTLIFDVIVILIAAVVFGMVAYFGWQAFTDIKPDIQADITSNDSQEVINQINDRYPSVFDALFVFIFLGLWAAGFVSALVSDQHPIIFGFMMLLMVFVVIIAAIFGNYFEETFQDDELREASQSFPMTNWIMGHLLETTIGMVATIVLALMGKNRVL